VALERDRRCDEKIGSYRANEIDQENVLPRIPIDRFAEIRQQQKNQEGEDSVGTTIECFTTWLMHQQPGYGNKRDAASDDE